MDIFKSEWVKSAYSTQFCSEVTVKPYRPCVLSSLDQLIKLQFELEFLYKLLKTNKIES